MLLKFVTSATVGHCYSSSPQRESKNTATPLFVF